MNDVLTATRPDEAPKTAKRKMPVGSRPAVLAYVVAAVLFAVATVISPSFASLNNIASLLLLSAITGIAAMGQTFVVLGGGIDLSIPWLMTCSAVLTSRLVDGDSSRMVWVVPGVLIGAAVVGALNGFGVAKLGIAPIVMTLGMGGILQGALLVYTQGTGSPAAPELLTRLASEGIGPFRWAVFLWAGLAVVAIITLRRGIFGRALYSVGSSRRVADYSGLRSTRVLVTTYVISGVTSCVAGLLLVGYAGQSFLSMGNPYLFSSVAAVAIGGTSILGGTGGYVGTVAGALILTMLGALLPILNLSSGALPIVYGAVILVAILLSSGRLRGTRAR